MSDKIIHNDPVMSLNPVSETSDSRKSKRLFILKYFFPVYPSAPESESGNPVRSWEISALYIVPFF